MRAAVARNPCQESTADLVLIVGHYDFGWYGVLVPTGVPRSIITQLNTAIDKTINTPEVKTTLNSQGLEPQASTPESLATLIHNEIGKHVKLVQFAGLKAE